MLKFIPDHVGGVGTKRKQAPKSCESCKKRHKRCSHSSESQPADECRGKRPTPPDSAPSCNASPGHRGRDDGGPAQVSTAAAKSLTGSTAASRQPAAEGTYVRFVGDLSPEASFLANRDQGATHTGRRGEIGVWLGKKLNGQTTAKSRSNAEGGTRTLTNGDGDDDGEVDGESESILVEPANGPAFRLSGLPGLQTLYPYLRSECSSVLPPQLDFERIAELFFAKFDPLFPVLHGESFEHPGSMETVALKQGLCLVAAFDPSLRDCLRLPHESELISQTQFRASIAAALKHSLDAGFIRDKVILLQVHMLMAFHVDKPSPSEISAYHCAQAVSLSQTLGLHLGWPDDGGRSSTEKSRRLFWCLWCLDRLNAAANGRPILMHRQDMDESVFDSIPEQIPSFRLLIRIARLLDDTISQYRPGARMTLDHATDVDHTFEDFVQEANATDVRSGLLASLEMFYSAVVILQSRPQKRRDSPQRLSSSNLQTFCAGTIISLATDVVKDSLTYWAVVPYAVSLAASVSYQSLRSTVFAYKRKQAYAIFNKGCDVLDDLGKYFMSARMMGGLAKETLQEMERASVKTARARPREARRTTDAMALGESSSTAGTTRASSAAKLGASSSESVTRQQSPTVVVPEMTANDVQPESLAASLPMGSDFFHDADLSLDEGGLFENFDPSFHLDRVDALFSANLNPTMPLFQEGWGGQGEVNEYF